MPRMGGSRDSITNVDTAVGTIVWVRRRNGSWWPGRIISDAELSTANLLSPRSGTPVKLLGREDGSVDWYNIEKSKRVKPFRCGDFEECIEKAKAVAGLPTKKREKYARREDAILHALELEKQQLECSSGLLESSTFKAKELNYVDHEGEREVSTAEGVRSRRRRGALKATLSQDQTDSGNSQVYPEEDSGGPSSSGRGQEEQDWDPEDEEVEGLPRMRGLQDFGLKIAAGRGRRSHANGACDEKPVSVSDSHQKSCVTQSGKCGNLPNGCKVPSFTTRRKRTFTGSMDEGALKKRDRRRPLTQVLESSAKLLAPPADDNSDLMQMIDDDALVEGNQPLVGTESMGLGFTSSAAEGAGEEFLNPISGIADRTCCSFSGNAAGCCGGGTFPSEEINQAPAFSKGRSITGFMTTEPAADGTQPCFPMSSSSSAQVRRAHDGEWIDSKQHLDHQMLRRPVRNYSNEGLMLSSTHMVTSSTDLHMDWSNSTDGKNTAMFRPCDKRLLKAQDPEEDMSGENVNMEQVVGSRRFPSRLGQVKVESRIGWAQEHNKIVWLDVPVERQINSQKESVPMVLLASRLTKKPIVGYPVLVEAIESSISIQGGAYQQEYMQGTVGPVWRTARRTARQRLPRPCSDAAAKKQVEQSGQPLAKQVARKFVGTPLSVSIGNMRKKVCSKRPPLQHKETLSKKLLKKVFLSSRKTRTLSSIAYEQKNSVSLVEKADGGVWLGENNVSTSWTGCDEDSKEVRLVGEENGYGWPVATCIPVRVALSRIKAALDDTLKA